MTKKFPFYLDNKSLTVKISTDGSSTGPYFSITANLTERLGERVYRSCGCLHDEILQFAPHFRKFVSLHLCDLNGVPMHAKANGFHWAAKVAGIKMPYGPDQPVEDCFQKLQKHLRVSKREAEKIIDKITNTYLDTQAELSKQKEHSLTHIFSMSVQSAKDEFSKCVDKLLPRWKKEAEQALQELETL